MPDIGSRPGRSPPAPVQRAARAARRARIGPAGRRLAALLFAVLLVLAGSFGGMTRRDHDAALEAGWIAADRAALGAAEHAQRSLAAARLITDQVAETIRHEGTARYRGAGHTELARLLRYAPQVGSIWVLGPDGELFANSLDPDPPDVSFADRPFVARLRAGAETWLTPLRREEVSRAWSFSFNRPVRDAGGMLLGIVQAAMHADEFQRFQAGLAPGPGGRIGLFRRSDGAPLMLFPLPGDGDRAGRHPSPIAPPEAVLRAAEGGVQQGRFTATAEDGAPLLATWRVAGEGGAVIATAALPRAAALAQFQGWLLRNSLLFGLAAVLVCGLGTAVAAALMRGAAARRAAENGQRELGAVLDATGEGVIVLDAIGRIGFVNSRAALALGFGGDLTGRTLWEAMPDLAGGPVWRACEETMLVGRRAEAEGVQAPLGRRFRAEAHPREGGGLIVFFRDVTEEREAAARLAESEARLRQLFHAIDEGYALCEIVADEAGRPVDYRFLEVNPLFGPMTGLHDAAGRSALELVPDLEPHWPETYGRVALGGETLRFELGSEAMERWFDVFATPVAPRGRFALVFRDVTAQRQAERALRESEAQLRRAEEAGGIGVWVSDLVTGTALWSAEFRRLLGVPEDAPATRSAFLALTHPEDREMLSAAVRGVISGREARLRAEIRIRRADDGALRWLVARGELERDEDGRPARLVGATLDVTERHAAEAALAESEARLRRVLDSLFVFVAVLSPEGRLLEINRAPLDLSGLTIAEVRGRPFWECHWWSHDPAVQARLREACQRAAAGEVSRYDVEVRTRAEQRITIDFQIAPLRDAAGRVTHLIPSATDVTAQRKAEAALAESEARLRLAQEAGEVGVFERVLGSSAAHWSTSLFRLYGLDPSRGPWMEEAEHLAMLDPEERKAHLARRAAMRADTTQSRFAYEFRIRRADTGELRWLASRGEVVRDAEGRPLVIRGINQDVTERRRAEEQQMLLAREVDHRAKNALAVVQSIVGLTRDTDPERFRAAVIGRIAAMARAHTLLAREGWNSAELRELLEAEIAPHLGKLAGGAERVSFKGPKVALAAGAAQPLAMAIHEMATNASKYGALSVAAGRVALRWEAADDGGLVLRWMESGGPVLDGPPARHGFGSSVIRNTMERQLGGRTEFEWRPGGLSCKIVLPPTHLRWGRARR